MRSYALVTGASSGFGLLTSLELAKAGFHVLATMRNLEKKERLLSAAKEIGVHDQIEVLQLDVTDEESIEKVRLKVESLGRLDVLVNNAGLAYGGFAEDVRLEEWKKQFETNFFGVVAVTNALLPIMRSTGKGRIINVSSISGRIGFPGLSPYVASKYALEGYSESLRLELKPFGIDVVLIEPGSYQTDIWTSGKKIAEKARSSSSPYAKYISKIENRIQKGEKNFGNPLEVAQLIVHTATVKNPKLRYPVGRGVKTTILLNKIIPWKRWERIVLKTLE
jgi:NAD(P)-dependent dehydrogenase (short-subunit alcohol dehydrogenase family)